MNKTDVIQLNTPAHAGERLRLRRESRDLSLSEMSERTHIRLDYLAAIEALDESRLPAIGYALGFVRTYAQAMELNGDRLVAAFKHDLAVADGLPLRDAPHFILRRQWRLPRGFLPALAVVLLATSTGVWYGFQSTALAETLPSPSVLPDQTAEISNAPILSDGLLTLRTTAPSYVKITNADGITLISRIFVTGETWQGPAGQGYRVSVRDAGAVELYDGPTLIGPLGLKGEPLTDHILSVETG